MLIRAYGEHALLIEVADLDAVMALTAALHAEPPAGLIDLVPAARTVLLRFGVDTRLDEVGEKLVGLTGLASAPRPAEPADIAVVYDGDDLADVAAMTGLSVAAVIEAHTGREWVVAFTGFTPGFAYLTGGDPRLHVPRRAVPRTRVPPGSVALGGEFTGVYPAPTPGGWQLIGRTSEVMWDPGRSSPARLHPGMRVRFRRQNAFSAAGFDRSAGSAAPLARRPGDDIRGPERSTAVAVPPEGAIEVLAAGPRCTVQDGGRPGYAEIGVSPSGAADREAWARGNRLVGNVDLAGDVDGSASIEVTLGGLTVRSPLARTIALTGAVVTADLDGRVVAMDAAVTIQAGQTLRLGRPEHGLRTYLAVRGGVDVPASLGSRSRDELAGLGPPALTTGGWLPIGISAGPVPDIDAAPQPRTSGATVELRCRPGPRADWFTPDGLATLVRTPWTATDQLDRTGVRFAGLRVDRRDTGELPSEGLVRGAVQIPPSGQPIVFLADHPTTGGYPVIAVVLDADVDRLAQVRPGQRVRLRWA